MQLDRAFVFHPAGMTRDHNRDQRAMAVFRWFDRRHCHLPGSDRSWRRDGQLDWRKRDIKGPPGRQVTELLLHAHERLAVGSRRAVLDPEEA
jgi:hypothetical protein